jgi:hypothetical protein
MRDYQRQRITAYKGTFMQDSEAHDLMVRAMHEGVVAPSKLPRVLACWKGRGKHAWDEEIDRAFQYLSAWRLFNAFTYVLREATVFSIARRTQALQSLMDRAVGLRGF